MKLPKIGTEVVFPSGKRAIIKGHYNQKKVPGGVILDRPIDGLTSWNVDSFRIYKPVKTNSKRRVCE